MGIRKHFAVVIDARRGVFQDRKAIERTRGTREMGISSPASESLKFKQLPIMERITRWMMQQTTVPNSRFVSSNDAMIFGVLARSPAAFLCVKCGTNLRLI